MTVMTVPEGHPDTAPSPDERGPAGFRPWVAGLSLGSPRRAGELVLVPLLHNHFPAVPDVPMHEAIAREEFGILEQGRGTVHRVVARNSGSTDVLVPEGETLVGCKQNRMVVWPVLVGAGTTAPVSVASIERGRWRQVGPAFEPGVIPIGPHIRRRFQPDAAATLAHLGGPRIDQRRAWNDMDRRLRDWNVHSPTADYHAGLEARTSDLRNRLGRLQPLPGQVGVIAVHEDRLLGLEAVAHPDTWWSLAPRVLPAYLLGATSGRLYPDFQRLPRGTPAQWLEAVIRAATEARKAFGRGYDMVIRGSGITGSCLWHDGSARHLVVFPS